MADWYTLDNFENGSLASTWNAGSSVLVAGSAKVLAGSYSLNLDTDSPYYEPNINSYMFNSTFSSGTDVGSLARFKVFNDSEELIANNGIKFLFYSNGSDSFYEYRNHDVKTDYQALSLFKVQNGSETLLSSVNTINPLNATSVDIINNAGSIIINNYSGNDYTTSVGSIVVVDTTFISGTFGVGINGDISVDQGTSIHYALDNIEIYGVSGTPAAGSAFTSSLSETLSYSDSLVNYNYFNKPVSDTLTTSDSLTDTSIYNRNMSDTETTSDSLNSFSVYNRTATDTQTMSDSLSSIQEFQNTLSDTLGILDSITKEEEKQLTDSQSISDDTINQAVYNRTASDDLSMSDDLDKIHKAKLELSENLGLLDDIATKQEFNYGLSESMTLNDSPEIFSIIQRAVSDNFSLADDITKDIYTIISDNQGIVDSLTSELQELGTLLSRLITLTNSNTHKTLVASENQKTIKGENKSLTIREV